MLCILANPLTKRTLLNWVDLGWVYYFKEQEFKFSIEAMQICPRNK